MATGMATSYRGDQRRGPPPRPSGRQNAFGSRNQSSGMPRRNGSSNYSPSRHGNQASASSEDPATDEGFYANVRMVGSVSQAMGRLVQVQVVNGNIYEGILMAVSKDFCLKIDQARLLSKPKGKVETDVNSNSLMFKKEDYVNFSVQEIDIRVDTFVDGAISGINRVNGQSNDPPKVKTLVQWKDDSNDPGVTLEESVAGANGWDAVEMFRENKKKFNVESTYHESMSSYTTPLPTFKTKEEEMIWKRKAEEGAKSIEQSEGYKQRLDAENNPTLDEETRFSSVIRDGEQKAPAADRYVPPNRRGAPSDHNQRGAASSPVIHSPQPQPLPQREQRERRERGDARQESRESNRGWERNPMSRNQQHSMQPQPPTHMPSHSSPSQHRDVPPERLNNGDWRQDAAQRNAYINNRTVPPHHGVPQGAPPQRGPHHVPVPHPHTGVPTQPPPVQQMPVPVPVHPTAHPHPVQRNPPPAPVASAPPPVIPTSLNATPQQSNGEKPETQGHSQQASSPQGAPPAAAIPGGEKKSPRGGFPSDMDKKHADLKQFKKNFKVQLPEEDRSQAERRQDHEHEHVQLPQEVEETTTPVQAPPPTTQAVPSVTQAPPAPSAPSSTSQGTTAALVPSQGPPPVQSQVLPTSAQGSSTETTTTGNSSSLNPLAMEFKPRQQPTVVQVATPTPSATPPSQGLRQSPGMMATVAHHHVQQQQQQPQQHPQAMLMHNPYHYNQIMTQQPRMPIQAHHHPQQGQAKTFSAPKRAVVSVDPVAIAAQNATGQPLQLGQAVPTPSYVYHPVPAPSQVIQQAGQSYQMRLVQSSMPSFNADPNHVAAAASSNHNQHLFMQQPLPAHMPAGHLPQSMPQPAHLHQHQHHSHLSSHTLPPVSQTQGSHPHPHPHPHPSPSPVQHMGPGAPAPGGPQLNHHAQGAPPTSNTPQPQLAYGHQLAGMLPPQQAGHHSAMPAHSVAQGPTTPAMQFMPHQMQQGVNFSQAGGTGTSGPAPAHMQTGGHMGQAQHVVVMPQPPPQAINQAPMNPPHSHNHHQQHAAAAQFPQQIQGAANQMHTAGVGPNQHLLQGNVSAANAGMAMPHNIHHFIQPGLGGVHQHQHGGHHHSHNQQYHGQ